MNELENKRNEEMVVDNTDYLATIEAIQKNSVNKCICEEDAENT